MAEFLQRLKTRKLVQWALAYVAFSFALLQGVDTAYPPLPGNPKP
jgi:hypothetical protein